MGKYFLGIRPNLKTAHELALAQERVQLILDPDGRAVQSILDPDGRAASIDWIHPDSFHITIAFLGERNDTWIEENIRAHLAPCPPLQLQYMGVGAFPSTNRARVLWAGVQCPRIVDYMTDIRNKLYAESDYRISTPRPHVTLAKWRGSIDLAARWDLIQTAAGVQYGFANENKLCLYRTLGTGRYEVVKVLIGEQA